MGVGTGSYNIALVNPELATESRLSENLEIYMSLLLDC